MPRNSYRRFQIARKSLRRGKFIFRTRDGRFARKSGLSNVIESVTQRSRRATAGQIAGGVAGGAIGVSGVGYLSARDKRRKKRITPGKVFRNVGVIAGSAVLGGAVGGRAILKGYKPGKPRRLHKVPKGAKRKIIARWTASDVIKRGFI